MGQSDALRAETGAMRAIEAAIRRAQTLPPAARKRVLRWGHDRWEEASAMGLPLDLNGALSGLEVAPGGETVAAS